MTVEYTERLDTLPFRNWVARVNAATLGLMNGETRFAAVLLSNWSFESLTDTDRSVFDVAAVHWAFGAAFGAVGDVCRQYIADPGVRFGIS